MVPHDSKRDLPLASILGMARHGGGGEKREKKKVFGRDYTAKPIAKLLLSQLPYQFFHQYNQPHTHTPLVNFGHLQFGITIWILFYFFEVPFFDFGNSKKGKIEF